MSHLKINRDFTLEGVSYVGGDVVLEKDFPKGSVEGCKRVGHICEARPEEIEESKNYQVALAVSQKEAKARAKSEAAEKEAAEKEAAEKEAAEKEAAEKAAAEKEAEAEEAEAKSLAKSQKEAAEKAAAEKAAKK